MTDDETSPPPPSGDIHQLRRPASEAIPNLRRLMSKTRRIGIWADRIRHAYFSDPNKRRVVRKGEKILRQDETNDKLFYVEEGSFTCTVLVESSNGERERLELFRVGPGGFVGVRSFFSDTGLAVFDSTADEDSVVAWMDQGTEPVDAGHYGSLREQFFPVIMKELEQRQFRLTRAAKERVSARIRLHKAEDMATLGQFATGLAHELNNATSVLMSSSQHLGGQLGQYFDRYAPELSAWFRRGMELDANLSSSEVREKARELSRSQRVDYETAKDLVRMFGGGIPGKLPRDVRELQTAWMTGRSCRDILFASKHAANIIHSIKQLSVGGHAKREPLALGESISRALELLRDTLKDVDVQADVAADLPEIEGNIGEFMQIWLNLTRNAYEAMRDAATREPRICIAATSGPEVITVTITDNGPGIPEALRDTLFQPSITSKSGSGNSMGLGLGLYIVKRLVDSYFGRIEVRNDPEGGTSFVVHIPIDQEGARRRHRESSGRDG
ncbi:MAG: ATP-binding protein [Planctomycetaceae bacterium]|nr:ATP-binding protein [Planctomycetaceae bacterium]